uniref:Uncharacterized protein n=1 Tax=Sphaerodactylus townsendi TaxID=933632 RepID=A0ACB8FSV7_9SAUR
MRYHHTTSALRRNISGKQMKAGTTSLADEYSETTTNCPFNASRKDTGVNTEISTIGEKPERRLEQLETAAELQLPAALAVVRDPPRSAPSLRKGGVAAAARSRGGRRGRALPAACLRASCGKACWAGPELLLGPAARPWLYSFASACCGHLEPGICQAISESTMDLVTGMEVGAEIEVAEDGTLEELPLHLENAKNCLLLGNLDFSSSHA